MVFLECRQWKCLCFGLVAITGAFITALYTTRLMLVVFWGEMKTEVSAHPGKLMTTPLIILAVLSIVAGFIEWPHNLIHLTLFSDFVEKVLPATLLKEVFRRNLSSRSWQL